MAGVPVNVTARMHANHAGPQGLRVLREAAGTFWRDNAMGMAAMIAFFSFLSMVPLLILFLAFVGDFVAGLVSTTDIRKLFHSVMPGLSQSQFMDTYWAPVRHSKTATKVLGVLSLFLGTLGLHDAVDWAVNRLWQSTVSRSFWVSKLRGLAVIVWVIAFAGLSLSSTWLWVAALQAMHVAFLLRIGGVTLLPSLLLDTAIFTALYKLTPMEHVDMGPACVGGLTGAVLWEGSKIGFGWWVVSEASYNQVYGPLSASVIVMLWLWLSAMIFLYGASLSATLQNHRERSVREPQTDAPPGE
ncbi:MAG: YihY/virulence factor BrkB family protein [Chloroflexota bacterium]